MKLDDKGLLIVISGPSGVGKGTVRSALFNMEGHDLVYSISMTTRKPREGEVDGREYYFVSRDEFEKNIADGKMLEYAEFVGNYYGTPLDKVNEQLEAGNEVVLEIEVQGAKQVKEKMPEAISIFIMPPDLEALETRLRGRHTETEDAIQKRLEFTKLEMENSKNFDYQVINDSVENAVRKLEEIML